MVFAPPLRFIHFRAELALHVLAHVEPLEEASHPSARGVLARAASVFDRRYVAFVRAAFPSGACESVQRDAPLLGRLWAAAAAPEIARAAELPFTLSDSTAGDRSRPTGSIDVLAEPGAPLLCELVRCVMALAETHFQSAHRDVIRPSLDRARGEVGDWLAVARRVAPALGRFEVELSFVLGPRGRTRGSRIWVGAPAGWNDVDPAWAAMMSLHECAVALAVERLSHLRPSSLHRPGSMQNEAYRAVESLALGAVAQLALPPELMHLHRRWRSSLGPLGFGEPAPGEVDRLALALEKA